MRGNSQSSLTVVLALDMQDVFHPDLVAALGAAELGMESPRQRPCLQVFRCKEIRLPRPDGEACFRSWINWHLRYCAA